MSRRSRAIIANITLVVGAAMLAWLLVRLVAPMANLEQRLADIRIATMQRPQPAARDVAIVAIDEQTLATLPYRSPVDRDLLADLIEAAQDKGARAIAVDVLLDQPTEPRKDNRLRQLIRSARVPLIFSFTANPRIVTPEQLDYMRAFVPFGQRAEAALLTDPFDGTVRKINPGGIVINGRRDDRPDYPAGFVRKVAAEVGVAAPTEPVGIAWRAPPDAETPPFPAFSASYFKYVPDELVKDRVVLIGAVLSMTDRHLTPFAIVDDGDRGLMPGVFVQAHGLAQVLERRLAPGISLVASIALFSLSSALGFGVGSLRQGMVVNVLTALVLVALYWAGGILSYSVGVPMIPLLGPSMALVISLWLTDLLIGSAERRQRRFIQSTFSRYVSPDVVKQLMAEPDSVRIHGTKQTVSLLFTDIAGFTTLAEALPSEALAEVLNRYLDGACAIILEHGGMIDKFIGDAIMAIFNAPLPRADHATCAVRCALALDLYAEEFRRGCNRDGVPFGVTRIGVHLGSCVIGNFGSQSRMDFTALGDAVNIAARTEGANKYFGTRVCCTEEIVAACPNLAFICIGEVVLKGKHQATALYVPVSDSDADKQRFHAEYTAAYRLLQAGEPEACGAFERLCADYPAEALVAFHADRIAAGLLTTRMVMEDK